VVQNRENVKEERKKAVGVRETKNVSNWMPHSQYDNKRVDFIQLSYRKHQAYLISPFALLHS
jgi:hypothetical protein